MRFASIAAALFFVFSDVPACSQPVDGPPPPPPRDAGDAAAVQRDAAAPNACEVAGGVCTADPVAGCSTRVIGTPDRFSCAGAGSCCLPITTPPICDRVGELTEGWYNPAGVRICPAHCAGAAATCDPRGSSGEGWYAPSEATGCGLMGPIVSLQPCAF